MKVAGVPLTNLLTVATAAAMTSCVSMDEIAPPVSAAMTRHVSAPLPTLQEGRRLYLTACARCHGPEPVRDFTLDEWEHIMVDMAEETKLSPEQTEAVNRYIEAVWRYDEPASQAGES